MFLLNLQESFLVSSWLSRSFLAVFGVPDLQLCCSNLCFVVTWHSIISSEHVLIRTTVILDQGPTPTHYAVIIIITSYLSRGPASKYILILKYMFFFKGEESIYYTYEIIRSKDIPKDVLGLWM